MKNSDSKDITPITKDQLKEIFEKYRKLAKRELTVYEHIKEELNTSADETWLQKSEETDKLNKNAVAISPDGNEGRAKRSNSNKSQSKVNLSTSYHDEFNN